MRATIATLALICPIIFWYAPHVAAQSADPGQSHAQEAIEHVIQQFASTWNDNDIEAWGELFTFDVDYVHRGGGRWSTNAENIEGHRRIHKRLVEADQPMNLQLEVKDIAFLSRSIALVHVSSAWPGFTMHGGEEELQAYMTMVMKETEGTWLIRALQNTLATNPTP